MTATITPPTEEAAPEVAASPAAAAAPNTPIDASANEEKPVSVGLACVAALLATAAAGWMIAGIFAGGLPRLLGLLGPVIGAGMVALSYRTRRPSVVQYLILPVAVAIGAAFALSDAAGAGLSELVLEALRAGGLSQPPVPFDPGWRFVLLVLGAILGAGAASLSLSLNRPKIGIVLAVPFLFGGALVQPSDATALSAIGALVLAVGSMAVAFGADLAKEGATSGGFEARRLGRGAAVLAGTVAALILASQLGFLLPDQDDDQVIAAMRPQIPPPTPDRELFTVTSPVQVPWRLGVLDTYGLKENAWLTPPFRASRLAPIPDSGIIPLRGNDGGRSSTLVRPPATGADGTVMVEFRLSEIGGRVAPNVASTLSATGNVDLDYDPRTQGFRVTRGRARTGDRYTVVAPRPPSAAELIAAPPAGKALAEFLEAPEMPVAVEAVLREAPTTNLFDRLQFVRTHYYAQVVAAGSGEPLDVPPARVAEMLEGDEATPFEITAGEVLLARWAGVPARIGYGYYGGDAAGGAKPAAGTSTFSVRPEHGALWLEAYFEGHGWVPIVGTPPKAKASLSPDDKRNDPTIRPTDELALVVYVPIRLETVQLLFDTIRFWALRAAPWVIAAVLAFLFYPGALKLARRSRRRRWAARHGPAERIAVAYTELRDAANDFNIGDPMHTPLEFLSDLSADVEHNELAWLVTRALWGDLRRDLRVEDAEAAEEMARSVTRRLRRANGGLPRLIALGSRTSLRDPFSRELPNLWRRPRPPRRPRLKLRRRLATVTRSLRRRVPGGATTLIVIVVLAVTLSGCAVRTDLASTGPAAYPDPTVPDQLDVFRFVREAALEPAFKEAGSQSLVDHGRVYSVREGDNIQASLQVGSFKPGLRGREREVRDGLVRAIGARRFALMRIGGERVYALDLPEQRVLLWFPSDARYYQLLVARRAFTRADDVFVSLLAFQRSGTHEIVKSDQLVPLVDARRGIFDREQP